MASKILGCGSYLPKQCLLNSDLEKFLDTNNEWIKSRTGITQRFIAGKDEFSSHLAKEASDRAIEDAGIPASSIDLIIVCTTTPDNSFPSTASVLQGYLGLNGVPAFDIQAVCAGFVYGMHVADAMMKSAGYKTVLLVAAEKMSSLLNWQDRSTAILFGDGAGAVILQKNNDNSGVIDCKIEADGSLVDILHTNGGVSSTGQSGKILMRGAEVFRHAVEKMADSARILLDRNNLAADNLTYLIPHQANIRIMNAIAEKLNIDPNKVVKTISLHANCSAASIPLALAELKHKDKIKDGDLLLFTALGAGLVWGSLLFRW